MWPLCFQCNFMHVITIRTLSWLWHEVCNDENFVPQCLLRPSRALHVYFTYVSCVSHAQHEYKFLSKTADSLSVKSYTSMFILSILNMIGIAYSSPRLYKVLTSSSHPRHYSGCRTIWSCLWCEGVFTSVHVKLGLKQICFFIKHCTESKFTSAGINFFWSCWESNFTSVWVCSWLLIRNSAKK